MSVKYEKPPVVYTVAKLNFGKSIGNYINTKYQKLLSSLEDVGFNSYTKSEVTGIQLKQANNTFTAVPSNVDRVGYFSSDKMKCAIIDESSIEFRLSKYTNHSSFLDEVILLLDKCRECEVTSGNQLKEIELHYVDLFVPTGSIQLEQMFNGVALPNGQFYNDSTDRLVVGSIQSTRILKSGKTKVSVNLEQLSDLDLNRRKYLPDGLIEPDEKLSMPLDTERFFPNQESKLNYAIVHTSCSTLVGNESEDLRQAFELLYKQSRQTFDHMIKSNVCESIWKVKTKV
ncbi:TIGR04255 family protein [Catenovulum adriaticum]|uniref:TIGR04255 family protein n=1 Tax=Catenovulum adriaticum TaxID=2984846 RepID=A0ABY7AJI1_9ALTE|nr:TIGR04255 family protein [Catenovulum sp. TS8]WAJ69738.1 TIGR04255 family protein [Catenovulum sp. TS8]